MMILVLLLLLCGASSALRRGAPVIDTEHGLLRGVSEEDKYGREYDTFKGVPFAAPPVGPLRWQKPAPVTPWEGVRPAEEFAKHCIQSRSLVSNDTENQDEDCLYLNIFIPGDVHSAENLPVLFFIHGGAYILGSSDGYPGEGLALHGDVIVVTTSYRLGVIGFMSTGDEVSPGNYGLWDLWASLTWVKNNIAQFGGDPDVITVFGQSAGGDATAQLLLSPHTRDMFIRAIPISGVNAQNTSTFLSTSWQGTFQLGEVTNCSSEGSTTNEMVDCMRGIDAVVLDLIANTAVDNPAWFPTVDGDFVVDHPLTMWREGVPKDHDLMSGATFHDNAGFILNNIYGLPNIGYNLSLSATNQSTYNFILGTVALFTEDPEPIVDIIYERYPNLGAADLVERTIALTEMSTDSFFGQTAYSQAVLHSEAEGTGNTYRYVFKYRPSFVGYPDWVIGSHIDDLYSFFGEAFNEAFREELLGGDFNEQDEKVSNELMDYVINFAYTGDPNEGPLGVGTTWPQYEVDEHRYLLIEEDMSVVEETEVMKDHYWFWQDEFFRLVTSTR